VADARSHWKSEVPSQETSAPIKVACEGKVKVVKRKIAAKEESIFMCLVPLVIVISVDATFKAKSVPPYKKQGLSENRAIMLD
jgi:hypothetical protein